MSDRSTEGVERTGEVLIRRNVQLVCGRCGNLVADETLPVDWGGCEECGYRHYRTEEVQ